jgi:hypothetical protein
MSRPLVVRALGDLSDLERALTRSGIVAEDASKKIQGSFRQAGLAAAEQAKMTGASVDEQTAAAGRAAAAFTEMSAKITTAQRNAGKAAATAAGAVGASVDEQRAAYRKAIAVQSEYEAAVSKSATAAKAAAAEQAAAAEAATAKIAAATAKQAAAVESAQKKMSSLGKFALGGGALIAGFSVKGAMDLQTQMERIHTQANASQAEVNKLTKAVMGMAPGLATGPEALATSLYHVVSGGVPAAKALGVMSIAAKEAKISGADLTDTTRALTAVVYSGVSGAQDYTKAMGMMNAAVGAGDTTFQELNEAFGGPMLSTVKGYGLSLKDVTAALATFGDLNIHGADAATQLRMAVQYMAKPAATAGPLLEKLGLNTHSFANAMANGGLMPALQLLHDRMDKVGVKGNQMAQVIGALFTKKGASGTDILENSLGKLGSKYTEVGKGAGKQSQAWDGWNKTLAADMDHLKATVQALADKFGTYLIPKLQAAGNAIKDVIAWMGKHKAAAEALAITIGGVLGTAITVFAYTKAVAFVSATGNMVTGMSKVVSFMTGGLIPALGTVEGANATAGASFTAVGAEAGVGAAEVEAKTALMAGAVETSDAAIETANEAAGASFTALLGPIGLATAALAGFGAYLATNNPGTGSVTINGRTLRNPHLALGAGTVPSGIGPGHTGHGGGGGLPGNVMSLLNPGTPTGGAVPVPKSGSNAQRIAGALAAQGFSKVAIAGILGNLAQETGGGSLSGINTADSGTGASGMGGMGIAQWTAGRRQAEIAYAKQHNEAPTSLQAQVGYLVTELRTDFHDVFTKIQKAPNAAAAARIFDASPAAGGFEGGTDPGGIRERAAAQAMAMLTGSGGKGLSNAALNALLDSGKKTKKVTYGIPQAVENMLHLAQQLEGAPYNNQAGHAAAYNETIAQIKKFGTDCSGLVSVLLKEGVTGIRAAQTTQGLPTNAGLSKGTGRYVTVYDRHTGPVADEHTIIDILGHYFESGGNKKYNPSGGVTQLTAKQAAGELSGGGFEAFHPTNLNSPVKGGSLANVPGNNMPNLIAQLAAAFTAALTKAADAMMQRFGNLVQSGTIRGLSAALGENSSTTVTTPGVTRTEYGRSVLNPWGSTTRSVASRLHSAFEGMGLSSNMGQINRASGALVAAGAAGSPQDKAFESTVANLLANGQKALAEKLVAAHKQAMQALGQEMYAQQALKDAESLQLQATHLKDQTTMTANYDADALNVAKAQYQLTNDTAQKNVTSIRDMTQIVTDQFSGMVQAVEDHTQAMADAASAVVSGIDDQTQIQVDVLGERGLYGLNLVAQKLQVQLDQQKAADDKATAAAQQNLDAVTGQWHAAVQTAQLNVDQVTAQQDLLAAAAQQASDTVAIKQETRIQTAQAKMDAVTLHEDVSVVGPAQTAVDLNANAPKSQQDVLNNILKKATGQAGVAEGRAAASFQGVQDSANSIMARAQQGATAAQNAAQIAITSASQTLATVTGEANAAIANAQGTLTGAQNAGALAEAPLQSGVSVTQARASTQFAGSGAVINIYGVPTEDAGAIGNAASWALRTASV